MHNYVYTCIYISTHIHIYVYVYICLYAYVYIYIGGILGDDMGLGKTFQVNCLLTGLMRTKKIQRVLIIAPVSVLPR
jgi:hypothetical protein